MSAIGSASARGPEMWSDIELVRRLFEQRRQRRVEQGLGGPRVVQHALERLVDALRLADLLDRAAVVARVGGGRLLGAEDERLQRRAVRQAVVPLGVPEDHV